MNLPRMVYVEWVDSNSLSGWQHRTSKPNLNCVTIGRLIDEDDDSVTVAGTISLQDMVRRGDEPGDQCLYGWVDPIIIPRCSIQCMEEFVWEDL